MAASGMCDAGRVRRHLKRLLWRKEATVLLTGFQAAGTLGRLLHDGADRITIQGDEVRVRARIRMLDVYSGHADARCLVRWATERLPISGSVFLAHGEPNASEGLRTRLQAAGFPAAQLNTPRIDDAWRLTPTGSELMEGGSRLPHGEAPAFDWHNRRAALNLAISQALEQAPDDAAKEALIARLRQALATD